MNPASNQRRLVNFLLIGLFVFFLVALAVYNFFGKGLFGAEKSSADDSKSAYTYQSGDMRFAKFGETFGIRKFIATSSSSPYKLSSGYKSLNSVKFTLANIPSKTGAKLCVVRDVAGTGIQTDLYCQGYNLEASSNLVLEENLPVGLLIEPDSQYYCRVDLLVGAQDERNDAQFTQSKSKCEFKTDNLNSKDKLTLALDANLVGNISLGADLLPDMGFTAQQDLEIIGLQAAIVADQSMPESKFTDICISSGQSKLCQENYIFTAGVDGKTSNGNSGTLKITKESQFNFNCDTQEGVVGVCQLIAYIALPKEFINRLAAGNVTRDEFYALDALQIEKYCKDDLSEYAHEPGFTGISDNEKKISRCQAILTSTSY